MNATLLLPPSPALSICDSLDGIEDLDAYLDAIGPLSKYGTPPPPKKMPIVTVTEVLSDQESEADFEDTDIDYGRVALHFAAQICQDPVPRFELAAVIQDTLASIPVSKGMLSATFNIFCRYHTRHPHRGDQVPLPICMVIVATTCLMIHYLDDWAPSSRWWAMYYGPKYTVKEIEHAMMTVFAALDWNLHSPCMPEAIDATIDTLFRELAVENIMPDLDADTGSQADSLLSMEESVQGQRPADAKWVNGQPTPETTPPDSAPKSCRNSWLPLL